MTWNPVLDGLKGAQMISSLQSQADDRKRAKLRDEYERTANEERTARHGVFLEEADRRTSEYDYVQTGREITELATRFVDSETGEVDGPGVMEAIRDNPRMASLLREAESEAGRGFGSIQDPGVLLGAVAKYAPQTWEKLQGQDQQRRSNQATAGLMRQATDMMYPEEAGAPAGTTTMGAPAGTTTMGAPAGAQNQALEGAVQTRAPQAYKITSTTIQVPGRNGKLETVEVPSHLVPIIEAAALEHDIPADLLTHLIGVESRFDKNRVSPAGARGLTQFMPATAAERGVKFGDERSEIFEGAGYLRDALDRYDGDWDKTLAAYNHGQGNVARHTKAAADDGGDWKQRLPKETDDYVRFLSPFGAAEYGSGPEPEPELDEHARAGLEQAMAPASSRELEWLNPPEEEEPRRPPTRPIRSEGIDSRRLQRLEKGLAQALETGEEDETMLARRRRALDDQRVRMGDRASPASTDLAGEPAQSEDVSPTGVPTAALTEWTDEQRATVGLPPAAAQAEVEEDAPAGLMAATSESAGRTPAAARREFMLTLADAVEAGDVAPADAERLKAWIAKADDEGKWTWTPVYGPQGEIIAQMPVYLNDNTGATRSGPAIRVGTGKQTTPEQLAAAEERAATARRAQVAQDQKVAEILFPGKHDQRAQANYIGGKEMLRSVGFAGDGTTDVVEGLGAKQAMSGRVGSWFLGMGGKALGKTWDQVTPQAWANSFMGMYAGYENEKEFNQKIVDPIQAQWRKPEFNNLNQTQAIQSLTEVRHRLMRSGTVSADAVDRVIGEAIARNPAALELMARQEPELRQRGMLMILPEPGGR